MNFLLVAAAALVSVGTGLDPFTRSGQSLNGEWKYIVDPMRTGLPFWNDVPQDGRKLVQWDFFTAPSIRVPGDWNTQDERLFFYEGRVWYRKRFHAAAAADRRSILRFGAVNYHASVYLDGEKVGEHEGGFTPFAFDITEALLKTNGEHSLVVGVENLRRPERVPCEAFDWWNYGGITRDVTIFSVPRTYIAEGVIQCAKGDRGRLAGFIRLSGREAGRRARIRIPELGVHAAAATGEDGVARFEIHARPELWSPENPRLYEVVFSIDGDEFSDRIGFRTIETLGRNVFLNGRRILLKGACVHDEAPFKSARVHSADQVAPMIRWAKEMGCNYLRLAHYPHYEATVRELEKAGVMVWDEVPVYWNIKWDDADTYANAEAQLAAMIRRDANRGNVIIWSVANETPVSDARNRFLGSLVAKVREMDSTRLVSAALLHVGEGNVIKVEDPLSELVDLVSFNAYVGWYWSSSDEAKTFTFDIPYDKPVIVSEFGGGAVAGRHGGADERWTEEFQAAIYRSNLAMFEKIDGLAGLSPWNLIDFRSPIRLADGIQSMYNRKGLVSDQGGKKLAYEVMREFYARWQPK